MFVAFEKVLDNVFPFLTSPCQITMKYIYNILLLFFVCLPSVALSIGPYTDNDDTVHDQSTGLSWQRQTADINQDGYISADLYPTGDMVEWEQALSYCANLSFAGKTDWRLPNIRELKSIIDHSMIGPAMNAIFQGEGGYWSATTPATSSQARYVSFYRGRDYSYSKYEEGYVRCVRGGLWGGYRYFGHIYQSPMYGQPGTTFTQSGSGFTPNSTVTLQFRNHLGELLTPIQKSTDATGSFSFDYTAPVDKPVGTHSWWVVDDTTGQVSESIGYRITSTGGQETTIEVGSVTTLPPIRQDAGFGTLTSSEE
ncbi:MAG: DUF1566 domain-containing protein, partial [Candidatus Electrothrix sp. ATG2]|nr:DUF1566 domain-containing protein [Candidatus Electrothrix sp. ATG2]